MAFSDEKNNTPLDNYLEFAYYDSKLGGNNCSNFRITKYQSMKISTLFFICAALSSCQTVGYWWDKNFKTPENPFDKNPNSHYINPYKNE